MAAFKFDRDTLPAKIAGADDLAGNVVKFENANITSAIFFVFLFQQNISIFSLFRQ